ncbi:MAG: type II CRISPR RNA-guided endonuclease Cas9 [Ginsengibacter sp.]
MSKKILGLDLGTNSIGWALVDQDFEKKQGKILGTGSRIIPMSQDILGEFGKGNSVSQTAERTGYRSVRRLRERHLLRRERLHRVLNVLGFLPEHYANQIDFEKRLGKFVEGTEPKIAYKETYNPKKEKGEFEFIFKKSFEEMLEDFKKYQLGFLIDGKLIPYDWTIYYLRKKALTKKIEKEELAWILLNFNQKRGYYQLRGEEEEENPNKSVEFHSLKITEVLADEVQKGKDEIWYSLILENGWVYRRSSKTPLFDWKDKVRDFIVTTDLNDDGTAKRGKDGIEKRSFRVPKEDDWTLIKKKTEQEIDQSHKTVGTYIYETLLQNPKQKIKGKLVCTIERKFYKEELKAILEKQREFHPELQNDQVFNDCVRELYRNNNAHQLALGNKDFTHLFLEDIIFYQRPLKSKKSSIGNCSLEFRKYKINGDEKIEYLKAIPKSHPLYQEFRLWQWMYNLSIHKRDDDTNVTDEFLKNIEDYETLFKFLNSRKEVEQKTLLRHFKLNEKIYRWNFVEDKKYPCNQTKTQFITRLSKIENIPSDFLTPEIEQHLWHIIYSVTDKKQYETAIDSFIKRYNRKYQTNIDEVGFKEAFIKYPPFKSEYGSYSEKAIKKLLPLIRLGKYWNWEAIDDKTRDRISKILSGEFDEEIKNRVREKAINLTQENHFQGLQLWLASYVVYDRHSEADNAGKWNSVTDLDIYLGEFRQHSLRNPIVEQVVSETLRVVKDIWTKYGNGVKDFFNEIHIELGREMKNTAEDRKKLTDQINENENTNLRIKALLVELMNNDANIRPYSPMQQEILKIYEDGILNSNIEIPDDINKISKKNEPSNAELQRYKLWLEQKYRSPYTGQIIPLNKLFTTEYEIEHIIPQSRFFDDSFSNKVICESAINKLKDNQIGLAFIKNNHGTIVETGLGKLVKVFEVEEYETFVKEHYAKSYSKRNKLLLEDIPEKMIERQLNDTRYISKFISSVLSNIVRSETNDDGVNSKNIIPGNGKITSTLKQDWGLNDVWNELILPRFERMNQLTKDAKRKEIEKELEEKKKRISSDKNISEEEQNKRLSELEKSSDKKIKELENSHFFLVENREGHTIPTIPFELSKGFQKKRIDHRHHAMDALVIACATRDHVNLLNNKHAKSDERFDLNRKLRKFEKVTYNHPKTGKRIDKEVPKDFLKPWDNFTVDSRNSLETIVVSFKQNLRVINRTTNKYESYKDENGNLRIGKDGQLAKDFIHQTKGDSWAIRKPMHKETVSGKVDLKWVKVPKGKLLTATRKRLDTSFDLKVIASITDTGIQKILQNYLASKGNNPELAFSPEGIEDLNKSIRQYNNDKGHQPIYKVRVFELSSKFPLGLSGNKKDKYVEAAKGTNLFFAIYQNGEGKRSYETIPLNIIIERQKNGLSSVSETNEKGDKLLFHLSPNDLVYLPDEDERVNPQLIDLSNLTKAKIQRIYKTVSFSNSQCFFIKQDVATSILNKIEFSALNKMEKSIDELMIKDTCIKLKTDRLGNISRV